MALLNSEGFGAGFGAGSFGAGSLGCGGGVLEDAAGVDRPEGFCSFASRLSRI